MSSALNQLTTVFYGLRCRGAASAACPRVLAAATCLVDLERDAYGDAVTEDAAAVEESGPKGRRRVRHAGASREVLLLDDLGHLRRSSPTLHALRSVSTYALADCERRTARK